MFYLVKEYPHYKWFATKNKKWNLCDNGNLAIFQTKEEALSFETTEMKNCFKVPAQAFPI